MGCYACGSEAGSDIILCPECREKRKRGETYKDEEIEMRPAGFEGVAPEPKKVTAEISEYLRANPLFLLIMMVPCGFLLFAGLSIMERASKTTEASYEKCYRLVKEFSTEAREKMPGLGNLFPELPINSFARDFCDRGKEVCLQDEKSPACEQFTKYFNDFKTP
jgi:hypothetical protein